MGHKGNRGALSGVMSGVLRWSTRATGALSGVMSGVLRWSISATGVL